MNFLLMFVFLSIINVVFSTIRTILTVKGGKITASVISGGYFAFYNIMLIYTVAEFPMWEKCLITFVCNVIGVFVVKYVEERMRKDKLWKVEATVREEHQSATVEMLEAIRIPFNYIECVGHHTVFNVFCATQADSTAVKQILRKVEAKYFVSESKAL